jgi:hypothetical protein
MDSGSESESDTESFFDELYSELCIAFPCYALRQGNALVVERAAEQGPALVILTDADLLERYQHDTELIGATAVPLAGMAEMAKLVQGLPRTITHVTFDPAPTFHRRYPMSVLRTTLTHKMR